MIQKRSRAQTISEIFAVASGITAGLYTRSVWLELAVAFGLLSVIYAVLAGRETAQKES